MLMAQRRFQEENVYKVLIRWVLRKAIDGESLIWFDKSFHNEGAAEVNDLSPQDVS